MPSEEPRWLTIEEIVGLNEAEVAETQEAHFVRDMGLLESAATAPIQAWHYGDTKDVVALGAILAERLARNHPFEQGNKRTAQTACLWFIETNGYEWTLSDTEELGICTLMLTNGEITASDYAETLRPYVVPRVR